MKCYDMCKNSEITCPVKSCRHWISYGEDLNCTIIAIEKNQVYNPNEDQNDY